MHMGTREKAVATNANFVMVFTPPHIAVDGFFSDALVTVSVATLTLNRVGRQTFFLEPLNQDAVVEHTG